MKLMNSDYLVQRRNGLKINVSESEIADAVKDSKNKVNAAISYLLSKGFVLTRPLLTLTLPDLTLFSLSLISSP